MSTADCIVAINSCIDMLADALDCSAEDESLKSLCTKVVRELDAMTTVAELASDRVEYAEARAHKLTSRCDDILKVSDRTAQWDLEEIARLRAVIGDLKYERDGARQALASAHEKIAKLEAEACRALGIYSDADMERAAREAASAYGLATDNWGRMRALWIRVVCAVRHALTDGTSSDEAATQSTADASSPVGVAAASGSNTLADRGLDESASTSSALLSEDEAGDAYCKREWHSDVARAQLARCIARAQLARCIEVIKAVPIEELRYVACADDASLDAVRAALLAALEGKV